MRRGDVRSFVAPNRPSARASAEREESAIHQIDNFLSAGTRRASLQTREQNAITPIAISSATKRCAICSQIWKASTSDKPRASRQALIFANACGACIRNPRAVSRGKIENRQVAMLMAHCRPQRKLHINRERDLQSQCFESAQMWNNDNGGSSSREPGLTSYRGLASQELRPPN